MWTTNWKDICINKRWNPCHYFCNGSAKFNETCMSTDIWTNFVCVFHEIIGEPNFMFLEHSLFSQDLKWQLKGTIWINLEDLLKWLWDSYHFGIWLVSLLNQIIYFIHLWFLYNFSMWVGIYTRHFNLILLTWFTYIYPFIIFSLWVSILVTPFNLTYFAFNSTQYLGCKLSIFLTYPIWLTLFILVTPI